jgi:hypothetical protein
MLMLDIADIEINVDAHLCRLDTEAKYVESFGPQHDFCLGWLEQI